VRYTVAEERDPTIDEEILSMIGETFGAEAAESKAALAQELAANAPSERPRVNGRLRNELTSELNTADAPSKLVLGAQAAIAALGSSLAPADVDEVFRGAIQILDGLLASQDLPHASALLTAARDARAAA